MKSKVALIRCGSYHNEEVKSAVKRGLELLGGTGKFFFPGENILLKVNLLIGDPPEKCVTTHPAVFRAVAEILTETGVKLSYGDSPGFGSTEHAARKSGILTVAQELKIEIANFKEGVEIFHEKGIQNRVFSVARAITESDGIVSLPKFKTHALERFTGCIKNQFGCIVGIKKGEFHVKLPDAHDFARMLVDLNNYIRPRLYVMDGIMAMEGNGPRGGNPKAMNVLLLSDDPVAIDATACRMINLNPLYVPVIPFGYESGAGTYLESEIEIVGDDPESFYSPDFKIERSPLRSYNKNSFINVVNNSLVPKPVIIEEKCTKCGTCINNCPVTGKAINWNDGDKNSPPVYDYHKCIRCYCCQELCPENAIIVKMPVLRRIINTFQ